MHKLEDDLRTQVYSSAVAESGSLSRADITSRTKMKAETIAAIERDELQTLPGGIFIRGYLRAYAREVGCDPEEIVRRYRIRFDPKDVTVDDLAVRASRERVGWSQSRSAALTTAAIVIGASLYFHVAHPQSAASTMAEPLIPMRTPVGPAAVISAASTEGARDTANSSTNGLDRAN